MVAARAFLYLMIRLNTKKFQNFHYPVEIVIFSENNKDDN